MKVLIAEPLADAAIAQFKAVNGWNIVVSSPKDYEPHLADCDALVVRSAVKVNKAVLDKAPRLRVIGRAGVGVDNVDMKAATAAGVLVMNTPGGNAVSVAEHTLGFMLSLARMIPEASASTKSGKWEKKKFLGNELRGKTLGVVGLGNIGREVVQRAKAFEMTIIGSDPFVSSQLALDMGVELVDLEALLSRSDYISLHVGVTPETKGMINAGSIAKMKDGVRIINCARGGLVDEAALAAAIKSGKVAGAGVDVFVTEPAEASPLFGLQNVVCTPHLGAATTEAQENVALQVAEQMSDYLISGAVVPGFAFLASITIIFAGAQLATLGFSVVAIETYDTHERLPALEELNALDAGGPVASALVYSAKGAACLARLVSPRAGTIFRDTAFICISPRVARELAVVARGSVVAAETPDEGAMFELLARPGHDPAPFPIIVA
jgi:D-3-phosphoglycerate dehydrogenase